MQDQDQNQTIIHEELSQDDTSVPAHVHRPLFPLYRIDNRKRRAGYTTNKGNKRNKVKWKMSKESRRKNRNN